MTGDEARLLDLLAPYRRARDFHLYGPGNPRLLDLWRMNGRAFLGYRPANFTLGLKNILAQGGLVPLPSPWKLRLDKLLKSQYPQWPHRSFFPHVQDLMKTTGQERWVDPALAQEGTHFLGRPGIAVPQTCDFLWLINSDGGLGPEILLSKKPLPVYYQNSPLSLAAGVFGLTLLAAWEKLKKSDFSPWDSSKTSRIGPYLTWVNPPENYPNFFQFMLNRGFIIPPASNLPLILPLQWSEGEVKSFQKAIKEWSWNS